MKSLKFSLLLLISISILSSCETNEYEEPEFNGIGDVFVRCSKVGDETHYAPAFHAFANENLSEVLVESPVAEIPNYELSDYTVDKRWFRLLPETADYSTTDIANGIYKFELVSVGQETIRVQDKLLDSRIEAMEITDFTYKKEGHTFTILWNELDNADTYVVELMTEKDGKVLYISDRIAATEYEFNENSKNWNYGVQLAVGTTYWVGVFAYEFESATANNGSDINSETVEYREIVW
ncbi:hypothetical protein [Labilibaculum antarcticum]|uniref:DUF4377 domain-containing protein n=1 Tax=Labilibaculum antarcticum TaxID=1717717 RepID=A0A1Y1CMQ6_9BACT|nr:hypothetical protein [Labilibaculum antarcticum]BAX81564.1 hypothetical protein ALGA_3264 [Labilibaculum antarcticum]